MGDPVLGAMAMWPNDLSVEGWLRCDGRRVSTSEHPHLGGMLGIAAHDDGTIALPHLDDPVPGVHWIVASHGLYVQPGAPRPRFEPELIGLIVPWESGAPPINCVPANGDTVKITDYQALYAVVGSQYGGDGRTTYKLPDLRKPGKPGSIICFDGFFPRQG